jgi:hypothetical protein
MRSTPQEGPKKKSSLDNSRLSTRAGLALGLVVSAGLHLASGRAGVAAVDRHNASEAHARIDHQREVDQQRQRTRYNAVHKAEQETIHDTLDFWDFVRTVGMVEAEAANLSPLDQAALDRDFQVVVQRLHEHWRDRPITSQEDVRELIDALRYAFAGHHYYKGMSTISPPSFIRNKGGPCGSISGTTLAALATTSLRDSIGMRMYMPGEHGESGHLAPTLIFRDSEGVEHEVDLTAAGPAFAAGSRLTLNELVESYAHMHTIPTINHSPQLAGPTVIIGGNDHGLAFLFPLPQDRRPFPNGAVPFYSSEIFGAYQTDIHGNVILRNNPTASSSGEAGVDAYIVNHARERAILAVVRSLYSRQTTQDTRDLQNGQTDFMPQPGFSDANWRQLSDAIEKAEVALEEPNITPVERLKRLGLVIGIYQAAEQRSALTNLVDPMNLAQARLRYYQVQVDRWFASNDSNIATNSALKQMLQNVNAQYAIIMLGQRGIDMLFQYYDTELRENPDSRTRKEILVTLIVADATREEALRRVNALPIHDQFEFIQNMRNFSFGGDNDDRGPILSGNDPFSINYRDMGSLYGNMAERVFAGMPGEENTPPGTQPFRSMNQLLSEVHAYAQSHHYDQAWEKQAVVYGIQRAAGQVSMNSAEVVDRAVLREVFTPFFQDALVWINNHPEIDAHEARRILTWYLEHHF